MRIALTCSAGGHLAEMKQLAPFYSKKDRFFITFEREDTRALQQSERVHFIPRPARNPIQTIRAFISAWTILQKEKPDWVISTGADVTVPVCIAAKLQGRKVIFIESFCRPYTASWTGRILKGWADHIVYQWSNLKPVYPQGIFGGSIFGHE